MTPSELARITPVPQLFADFVAKGWIVETSDPILAPQRTFALPDYTGTGRLLFVEPDDREERGTPSIDRFWVSSSEDDITAGLVQSWGDAVFESETDFTRALQALNGPINVDALSEGELRELTAHERVLFVAPEVRCYARLLLDARRLRLAGRVAEAVAQEREVERLVVPSIPAYLRW